MLDCGRIVESGTPEELVAAGGAFARLWEAWSAGRQSRFLVMASAAAQPSSA